MKSFIEISLISLLFQGGYAKQVQTNSTAPIKSSYVQGSYIVTLKPSTEDNALEAHLDKIRRLFGSNKHTGVKNKINHVYGTVLLGYSAEFTNDVLAKVNAMPEVEDIGEDQLVEAADIQTKATWGLARLSSKDALGKSKSLSYNYDPKAGEGVDVYVIDSGIKIDHPDFQGRAKWGANFADDVNKDSTGHGTHVAGIIGSKTYGVAKRSTLFAVKVIDHNGIGSQNAFIAGIEWVVQNKKEGRGCVINLSMGVKKNKALNTAVHNAVKSGCVVVVAAGNTNVNACDISPASEPSAITVGASTLDDKRASFSNWGRCLDVYAPGDNIVSLSNDGGESSKRGTSMAAGYVSGLVANIMSKTGKYNPDDVLKELKKHYMRTKLVLDLKLSPRVLVSNIGLV
ncbi:proteinase B [Entomophthora muscae]|uniref:Proteinase B n=1 Tax=Entomophthora muscae TaxID=34485 RepID=A0ACC2SHY1_9FUNG|nr:proteinase B [Entomophthora muscae]